MWRLDPFHWMLKGVLRNFFDIISWQEVSFVNDNIVKHRKVLWLNVGSAILVIITLRSAESAIVGSLINALIAPVMVMGTAWFAVSFGGVPTKLMKVAMSITFWLFTAFTVSLTTMFLAVGFVSPLTIWPVLLLVYMSAIISCILYDTVDGLKVGLDDAQLKHSRAALLYYKSQGITPQEDGDVEGKK